MLSEKVVQGKLDDISNYNDMWENAVSRVIEQIYVSAPAFKTAYESNSTIVMKKVNSKMKISPIDLKETLQAFYQRMIPEFKPDDGPQRQGVA